MIQNPKYDINSNDPLEMIWAIREKIYAETKDMTREERTELLRQTSEKFNREREQYRLEKRQLASKAG